MTKWIRWMVCLMMALALSGAVALAAGSVMCDNCGALGLVQDEGEVHRFTCENCGFSWSENHFALCDQSALDECALCGNKSNVAEIGHVHYAGQAEYVDEYTCRTSCYCGEEVVEEPHYAYCGDLEACSSCGTSAQEITIKIYHDYMNGVCGGCGAVEQCDHTEYGVYSYKDADICLATCACGESSIELAHCAWCTDRTVCMQCGASEQVNIAEIFHSYNDNDVCVDCGAIRQNECKHFRAFCDAPTMCVDCGATDITPSNVYHPFDFIMVDDGVEHHQECSGCGEVFWRQEHYIACIAEFPAICWVCHLEIGEEAKPSRLCSEVCEDRGDTHYIKCELCGKVTEGAHEVACTKLSYCTKCKAENVSVSEELIKHGSPWVGQNTATYTDETHTYTCPDCGETVTRPHEYDKNGNDCMYCDYWRQNILPGDADNSNGVTLADAVAVLQYCVDESVSINTANADVTGDGVVNEQDVLRIMQYDAGWDVTLK